MRAYEFLRENVEHFNGLDFSIEIEKDDEYVDDDDTDNQTIYVRAFANGRELGHVLFTIDYDGQGMILKPQYLEVKERYQGQGIAKTMYDYVKSKGYRIRRSGQQTDAGAGFWNKHRPEQNVWEAFDQPYPHEIQQKSEFGDYDTLVRLPDGKYLEIMFNNEGNDEWQVEFHRNNSQGITGEGDAQRIFATVLNAIQKFVKEHNPWRLIFSASKEDADIGSTESRAKLYNRLVQRYAAAWGYDNHIEDQGDQVVYELTRLKPGVAEGFPQPGESSGKAKQFNPNAKVQTKEMTLNQILNTVKGIPYVNNVIDDWDAKDYSWNVTKKVIEYAQYLQKNPQSVANLPPLVVIDGQLNDGAHRLSAINLLQKRMDSKNPLWKQVKLKVNFGTSADVVPEKGMTEGTAQDITKMFGNMYDPLFANLQRVAILAMQGRQSEAELQLHRAIKDADPAVQQRVRDAVNQIKPVTINGKIADSSTLDKSQQHQEWIQKTFIPWVQSQLSSNSNLNELYEPENSFPLHWYQSNDPSEAYARAYDRNSGYIDIKFTPISDNTVEVEFSRNDSYDMTGGGDANRVLGTVLEAFREYLKGYQPKILIFSAKGASRSKVYQNLINRFASSVGYKQFDTSKLSPETQEKIAFSGGDVLVLRKVF